MMNVNLDLEDQRLFFSQVLEHYPFDYEWDESIVAESIYKKMGNVKRYRLDKNLGTLSTSSSHMREEYGSSTSHTGKTNLHAQLEGVPVVKIEVMDSQEVRELKDLTKVCRAGELKLLQQVTSAKRQKAQLEALVSDAGHSCLLGFVL